MLVAFTGGKGHGKTTAAQVLIDMGWPHINFAEPLKASCGMIFGLTPEEMEDAVLKETVLDRWPYLSPRHILQHVGTDLFRDWLDDTWVNAFERRVQTVAGNVVCSDLRFPNEAVKLASMGATTIRIINPNMEGPTAEAHRGESSQLGIVTEHTILNDSDVATLRRRVLQAVFGQ